MFVVELAKGAEAAAVEFLLYQGQMTAMGGEAAEGGMNKEHVTFFAAGQVVAVDKAVAQAEDFPVMGDELQKTLVVAHQLIGAVVGASGCVRREAFDQRAARGRCLGWAAAGR